MSAPIPSPIPPLSPPIFDGATVSHDEEPSSVPFQTKEWVTAGSLAFLAKRVVDLTGALVGLMLLTPVILTIAFLIRLDSDGPVLFRQLRRGHRGRLFRVLKFRTMSIDAEQRLGELEGSNESAGGVLFKLRDDPRVTRLGRFLRCYSLDELPQLINVLWGEIEFGWTTSPPTSR